MVSLGSAAVPDDAYLRNRYNSRLKDCCSNQERNFEAPRGPRRFAAVPDADGISI